jgi:hypothetical protein
MVRVFGLHKVMIFTLAIYPFSNFAQPYWQRIVGIVSERLHLQA